MFKFGGPTVGTVLLWIKEARVKDKTYIWVSVRWKTKNVSLDWVFCLLLINKARGGLLGSWLPRLFIINRENESYSQNLWMSRSDERLKARVEESTYLTYTDWVAKLETFFVLLWINKERAKMLLFIIGAKTLFRLTFNHFFLGPF